MAGKGGGPVLVRTCGTGDGGTPRAAAVLRLAFFEGAIFSEISIASDHCGTLKAINEEEFGGRQGIRTPGLIVANDALSQLS